MPRVCTVCAHPERNEIENAAIDGVPLRNISKQFSVGYVSIQRHMVKHLSEAVKDFKETQQAQQDQVKQEQSVLSGNNALDRMARGEKIVDEIIKYSWNNEPNGAKMPELALKALSEMRRMVELRAKIEGELDERSITITAVPEWRELRTLLLEALGQHPQAKMAVMRALEAYDRERSA